MKVAFTFLLLASTAFAADPQVHRDIAYAQPKHEQQTLNVFAPAEGKTHGTINSELGLAADKPTKELFEFLQGVLKKSP